MKPEDVITTIADALRDKPVIRALFLSGSYGNGRADAYSDIDFVLAASDGATDEVAALWRDAIGRTGQIVLWHDRIVRPALINAITADWTRLDVILLKPDQMKAHSQASLKPLFDHDSLYDNLPESPQGPGLSPARLRYQIEEFIRILGLLVLAEGRQEHINGVTGVFHLRTKLIDLMIEETGAPGRGGALHVNRLLTDTQKATLTALPIPAADREAMIGANLAYAKAYLPLARRLAAKHGAHWPEDFEAATWAKLKQSLDIDRPYDP